MTDTNPSRPISNAMQLVRSIVRLKRILIHRMRLHRKLQIGNNVFFGRGCILLPPDYLIIGDNVAIGRELHLEANLLVGNDVLISSYVSIVGNDHSFDNPSSSVFFSGRMPPANVIVEGDNLIGHKAMIIGSVTIGRGCIVGAGSMVTHDLPQDTICYGIPAKPRRRRYPKKELHNLLSGGAD